MENKVKRTSPSQSRPKRLGRVRPPQLEKPLSASSRNYCVRSLDERPNVRFLQTGGEVYEAPTLSLHPSSNGLVRFKESKRWYISAYARRMYNVPYIDYCGRIHATTVGRWYCEPEQLFATLVATVYKRLVGNCARNNLKKRRPRNDLLFQASLLYVIKKDSSFFLRVLCMLSRRQYTELRKYLCFVKHRLDANKRFLYGQACQSASWLQHRTRRPSGRTERDKSRLDDCASRSQHTRASVTERALTSDSERWSDTFVSDHLRNSSVMINLASRLKVHRLWRTPSFKNTCS